MYDQWLKIVHVKGVIVHGCNFLNLIDFWLKETFIRWQGTSLGAVL